LTLCIYIERLRYIIHAILWCSKHCDCNKAKYYRRNALWLWNPTNHCGENMTPSLPQSCAKVSAALKVSRRPAQRSQLLHNLTIREINYQSTWECSCQVWTYFALLQGGLVASGST
jgi:hypothetical protein